MPPLKVTGIFGPLFSSSGELLPLMYPRWQAPPPPQSGTQASSTWYPLAVADATLAKTGLSLSSSYGTHVGRRNGTLVEFWSFATASRYPLTRSSADGGVAAPAGCCTA